MTRPTIEDVIRHAAMVYRLEEGDLLRSNGRLMWDARFHVYSICRMLRYTAAEIGRVMDRDESTVSAGARKAMAEDSYKATRLRILASLEARAPIVARLELVLDGDGECSIVGDVPLEWTDVVVDMLESYAMSLKGRRPEDFEKPRDCDVVLQ